MFRGFLNITPSMDYLERAYDAAAWLVQASHRQRDPVNDRPGQRRRAARHPASWYTPIAFGRRLGR
jgi:hypothetical protein